MNKTKTILAATGGAIGVATLAMGFFAWSAYSDKTVALEGDEETDGLETVVSKAQTISRKPVYPCDASIKALSANAEALAEWNAEALKLASAGDRIFEKTTPAAFKTFIVGDAKRLAALPGAANGVLVKPDFAFGPFKDYIAEGKMPADDQLAELQRRWDDVVTVVEVLAKCGICELTGVEYKTIEEKPEEPAKKDNRKQPQRSRKGAEPAKAAARPPAAFTYVFTFTSRAPGIIKAINALSTGERFIVIDDFTFGRTVDAVAEALGGDSKKSATPAATGGRRGRRRAAQVEQQAKTEEQSPAKAGLVTDPVLDAPYNVTLTATVYDFHSLEDEPSETETEKKGSAK